MSRILSDLEAALPELGRAIFSQPLDSSGSSRVDIRPMHLKGRRIYQVERFCANKAYHENVTSEALLRIAEDELDGRFRQVLITTSDSSAQYVLKRDGSYRCSGRPAPARPGELGQNREKTYILSEGEDIPALTDLGIFTADHKIVKAKYDKYKQINRFIELIDNEFSGCEEKELTVLDFGCGKSYLTFIMYYYFRVKKGMRVQMIGYDLKADVVESCNEIARKYGYDDLQFVVSDVTRDTLYDRHIDMIVTLHACDTATDYALYYAASRGVKHIFSVPCCQHEVNSQISRGGDLDILMKHGIIKERMSALLTDSIRAEVLEDMGYKVDLIEFIDFEHSPKNLMIRAEKVSGARDKNLSALKELAQRYGFRQTLLELCSK